MESRTSREKHFHDERFGGDDGARQEAAKFYAVTGEAMGVYRRRAAEAARDGVLLEYGCATGAGTGRWLDHAKRVVGIDISSEAIERANARFQESASSDRVTFMEMNAEQMTFDNRTFDAVVGNGILHHLDLEAAYSELARVLRRTGTAVFIEPMGHNPVINWYRNRTPGMRTPDEHPLLASDLELARDHFRQVEHKSFVLSALAAVPLRKSRLFAPVRNALQSFDHLLFRIPRVDRHAWFSVIRFSGPRH